MQTETTIPNVGALATMRVGSDAYPAVVTKVARNGREVTIQTVDYLCVAEDASAGVGHKRRLSALNGDIKLGLPDGFIEETFTLRKNGEYISKGDPQSWGTGVSLGDAVAYRDPHF